MFVSNTIRSVAPSAVMHGSVPERGITTMAKTHGAAETGVESKVLDAEGRPRHCYPHDQQARRGPSATCSRRQVRDAGPRAVHRGPETVAQRRDARPAPRKAGRSDAAGLPAAR